MNIGIILLIPLCYLLGSIPSGYLLGKWLKGIDLREVGSRSTGATNVLRTGNKSAAVFTLFGDALKGFIPMIYFMTLGFDTQQLYLLSFSILIGHSYSIFLNFSGGKGVATSLGIIFALVPSVAALIVSVWLLVYYLFRVSGVSALIGFLLLPLFMYLVNGDSYMIMISFLSLIHI